MPDGPIPPTAPTDASSAILAHAMPLLASLLGGGQQAAAPPPAGATPPVAPLQDQQQQVMNAPSPQVMQPPGQSPQVTNIPYPVPTIPSETPEQYQQMRGMLPETPAAQLAATVPDSMLENAKDVVSKGLKAPHILGQHFAPLHDASGHFSVGALLKDIAIGAGDVTGITADVNAPRLWQYGVEANRYTKASNLLASVIPQRLAAVQDQFNDQMNKSATAQDMLGHYVNYEQQSNYYFGMLDNTARQNQLTAETQKAQMELGLMRQELQMKGVQIPDMQIAAITQAQGALASAMGRYQQTSTAMALRNEMETWESVHGDQPLPAALFNRFQQSWTALSAGPDGKLPPAELQILSGFRAGLTTAGEALQALSPNMIETAQTSAYDHFLMVQSLMAMAKHPLFQQNFQTDTPIEPPGGGPPPPSAPALPGSRGGTAPPAPAAAPSLPGLPAGLRAVPVGGGGEQ